MADACIDIPNDSVPDIPDSFSGVGRQDFLSSIIAHGDFLFNTANDDYNHPEADIRQRFLNLRTIRAHWIEWRTRCKEFELQQLMGQMSAGKRDLSDPQCLQDFETLAEEASSLLDRSSKNLKYDTAAAKAPAVDQFFGDNVFRHHVCKEGVLRAPNGELVAFYGSKGTPVPARFTSLRGSSNNLFRHVIIHKLMIPFNHRVYIPSRRWLNEFFHLAPQQGPQGLTGHSLKMIVSALECMLSVLLIAISVIVLYNVHSMKNRIIATTFLSLAFPYFVVFLSDEAARIFTLTAAYWAVTIVFISTSSYNMNKD